MKHYNIRAISTAIIVVISFYSTPLLAQRFSQAVKNGDANINFRLRYETVEQDNALRDASGLTLRSVLQYDSDTLNSFSATLQVEDVRAVAGVDDYSVPITDFNLGIYSVIADPKSTEINQAFLKYQNAGLTLKAGRQLITYDNQRFLGAVGWRQDWQVFDGLSAAYDVNDKFELSYNFINQRKRIFADDGDIDSKDHLFHVSYATPIGSLVGYAYLLETDNVISNSHDTYGIRLNGSTKIKELEATYLLEYASQESQTGPLSFDAAYFALEGGLTVNGVTGKFGYEMLGSDNGLYGFSTPLATGHAFNGWADMFLATPAQGLNDLYINFSTKVLGGTLTAVFHDYNTDVSNPTIDDLGHEIDLQFVKPISDSYTIGIKYANYKEGDLNAKPNTQKLSLWFQTSF